MPNTTCSAYPTKSGRAQKTWHRLRGHKHLADVITEVKFKDGIKQADDKKQDAT